MTDDDIQRGLALCEAATPGPWRAISGKGSATVQAQDVAVFINVRRFEGEYIDETVTRWQADAAFIASARALLPAALHEVQRLNALYDELLRSRSDGTKLAFEMADQAKAAQAEAEREVQRLRGELEHARAERDKLRGLVGEALGEAREGYSRGWDGLDRADATERLDRIARDGGVE